MKITLEKGDHVLVDFKKADEVHYLRWVIIDDKTSQFFEGTDKPPKLVYSSNFDGSVENHLKKLSSNDLDAIHDPNSLESVDETMNLTDQIYGCCEGYPTDRNPTSRLNYFKKHTVKVSAFYKGSPRRTVKQILQENELRKHIRDLLEKRDWNNMSSREMHDKLKAEVFKDSRFTWAKEKFRMPRINWFKFVLLIIVIIILLPIIIIWQMIVQFGYENKDKYFTTYRSDIPTKKTEFLEEYEDLTVGEDPETGKKDMVINYQNQFSQLVDMKPGKVRLITFKAMMLFARVIIPIKYVEGTLLNIPTIHFARWVLFDDNKRVLFFSNFDGSWQQYLGDFIDQSGWGLSAIFSNTTIFPRTNWLGITGILSMNNFMPKSKTFFPGGAYDEEHFLAWSRSTELPTDIWYSAYPDLSIKNVNNNSRIRSLLAQNLSEKRAEKFFELI
ncbi:MAG: hypothetical protein KJO04_07320 [Bacteroidia bacterium]|nr:hypothetical protein [Bacteroidia bacterium]